MRFILESLNPTVHFQGGDVNRLPVWPVLNSSEVMKTLEREFLRSEAARESSVEFIMPGRQAWKEAAQWGFEAVADASTTWSEPVGQPPAPAAELSFALGVALGRFHAEGGRARGKARSQPFFIGTGQEQADSLTLDIAKPLLAAWQEHGAVLHNSADLRLWLRTKFFADVHRPMYDNRPVYFPLSSSKRSFVAFIHIHGWGPNTLRTLLADHVRPALADLRRRMDATRGSETHDAQREFAKAQALREELTEFDAKLEGQARAKKLYLRAREYTLEGLDLKQPGLPGALLAIWWMLDMAFVWGSPRSYEQYYLPLCGSAAMLSGFVVWKWQKRLMLSANKMPLLAGGVAVAITLSCLSIPIFIGQRYSPDIGADYVKNYGHRRRGFGPALKELPSRKQGAWVAVGEHIRTHSNEDDTMYVWGWMPGIYVRAQRMAPVSRAFYGDMHITPPRQFSGMINQLVRQMKENPPRFIVDSRKRHFPNDRPPLELWPIVPPKMFGNEQQRPLKNMPQEIAAYDTAWSNMLETRIEPAEAERYEAMKPFRDYVMNNYKIVKQYGNHLLFERK